MGDVHELDDPALVRALRALGDTTRFRIVQEIAAERELCCGEVAALFDVTQPTISHHLKVLCTAGVLSVRCHGKHRYISVNQPLLSTLAHQLPGRLTRVPRSDVARARPRLVPRQS